MPAERRTGVLALVLIGALVAAGAALRTWHIARPGVMLNETASLWVLDAPTLGGVAGRAAFYQVTPPGYFLLTRAWQGVVGRGVVTARAVSAAASVATLAVLAVLARRIGSWRTAVLAVALAAFTPAWIEPACQARAYALGVLVSALAWLAWLAYVRAPGRRQAWLLALAMAAETWCHIVLVPAAVTQALLAALVVARGKEPRAALRTALLPALAAALLALPAVAIAGLSAGRLAEYTWVEFGLGPEVVLRYVPVLYLALAWLGFVAAAALAGAPPPRPRAVGPEAWLMLAGGVALPGFVLYAAALLGSRTLFIERYWSALLVPSLLLTAWLLDVGTRPRVLAPAAAAAVILLGAKPALDTLRDTGQPVEPRLDWRVAMDALARHAGGGAAAPGGRGGGGPALVLLRPGYSEVGLFDPGDAEAHGYLTSPLVLAPGAFLSGLVLPLPFRWERPWEQRLGAATGAARAAGRAVVVLAEGPLERWGGDALETWLGAQGWTPAARETLGAAGTSRTFEVRVWSPPR